MSSEIVGERIYEGYMATFNIGGEIVEFRRGDRIPADLPDAVRAELIRATDETRAATAVGGIVHYDDLTDDEIIAQITPGNAHRVRSYEKTKGVGAFPQRPAVIAAATEVLRS